MRTAPCTGIMLDTEARRQDFVMVDYVIWIKKKIENHVVKIATFEVQLLMLIVVHPM